ncbi:phage portal protein [Amycolatopsis balhimycina]|nr:phage portal protein [Amycolatopsis balhimycina]
MHPELLRRLDQRVRQVVVNWPERVVDAFDECLDVTGFRLGGEQAADWELWRIWRANRLGLHSCRAHVDALTLGRSFAIVGTNECNPATPLVTVESPSDVHVELDPRTREVRAALKWQRSGEGDGGHINLLGRYSFLPPADVAGGSRPLRDPDAAQEETDEDELK